MDDAGLHALASKILSNVVTQIASVGDHPFHEVRQTEDGDDLRASVSLHSKKAPGHRCREPSGHVFLSTKIKKLRLSRLGTVVLLQYWRCSLFARLRLDSSVRCGS